MKKIFVLLVIICGICNQVIAEEITLDGVKPEHIEIPKNEVNLKTSLVINDDSVMQEIISKQKEKDLEDIEALWKGTVDNNQVIGFALKKLATPESQRRIHASLMSKTLSALVAGASFAPMMMGGDYLMQTSAFAAGRLAQNLINKKNVPTEVPLTDTETCSVISTHSDSSPQRKSVTIPSASMSVGTLSDPKFAGTLGTA